MDNIISTLRVFKPVLLFFLFSLSIQAILYSQSTNRVTVNMNEGWKFIKDIDHKMGQGWTSVHLPHTWNIDDVMDDEPGYYRGIGWYKKTFTVNKDLRDKEVSIYFEGANQETEVFVNGKKVGDHVGGYTAFSFPISPYLKFGEANELLVKVDNSYNENIAPLTADFTFYGGIYRDVYLRATDKIHFSTADHATSGVYVTMPFVSDVKADVSIRCTISNNSNSALKLFLVTSIVDEAKKPIAKTRSTLKLTQLSEKQITQRISSIKHPMLWSPEHPYLYKVITRLIDEKGKVIDEVVNPLGFRWFRFDADSGFFLNGRPYKLLGASRHQDYKGLGNAVPDSLAIRDVVLLKNMGANFFRIAHYPQDPCVLKACDSLGLLTSVEIPIVNEITESASFYLNCEQMLVEMIRQNFNHPSVIIWCYMNEVLLKPHFTGDAAKQKKYISNITALAQRLENLTRREDPFRYTMMANHGNLAQYKNAGLLGIPMVVGWNLYSGWYGGTMSDFPRFLDMFHSDFPATPFMVTEYGADADPRIRSAEPVRFDKSIEYTTNFHRFYFKEIRKRKFVAGAVVWNLADFNSETRTETMPHVNNKGLMEWDRTPKDPYYFYKAVLSKNPFIKILGSCENKFGIADSTSNHCYQRLQIASNLDSVSITLNGVPQTKQKVVDCLCEWKLPFKEGSNTIIAEGRKNNAIFSDTIQTKFHLQSPCLTSQQISFKEINIMLGSSRYFIDEKGNWWQPDQCYQKGGWGSIGGKKFQIQNNRRLPYGTDKNIVGTDDDPIYQTQVTGIKQYRFEVPPGQYQISFHFAELAGGKTNSLAYNLSEEDSAEQLKKHVFNVSVNGRVTLDHFNIAEEYGLGKAVVKSTTVTVNNNEGILVDFTSIEGEPVLNALQLKKLD